jgi:ankyrin repeat protein
MSVIKVTFIYDLYSVNSATTKLLEKCPDLVNKTKKDGNTALHVAAINDHREVAETLITKVSVFNKFLVLRR